MCPPLLRVGGGGGKDMFVSPHFQTQNVGLGIEPTDICDVTLAWLASRCWARQMWSSMVDPRKQKSGPHVIIIL